MKQKGAHNYAPHIGIIRDTTYCAAGGTTNHTSPTP